ncbi:urease accessory protein UreF [Blastococcus sp. TF02-09]|uniref:urease accessory protein UreF n=1 Tax=Blastococcus sp. TF02-09 TaxID=2250576 RepID=UPI000DEA92FE|nr:urease accessory UreF family protein [Blastococcus sp. TF02-9]RBY79415.1 urease accessory protein UreF [Blastococcus sp. TF02-9]
MPALLLLADGRLPAGGHAHSGGLEPAVELKGVHDVPGLVQFLAGRLTTVGLVAAAFAAATCQVAKDPEVAGPAIAVLDQELEARTASPALRVASRRLGRQLVRAGRTIWPHPLLDELSGAVGRGPHQPVALGVVAAAAGLAPADAALLAAQESIAGPATAAVRLLGLDPVSVHAALARFGPEVTRIAGDGADYATSDPADLPATTAPLLDVLAEHHATWEVRLFAS